MTHVRIHSGWLLLALLSSLSAQGASLSLDDALLLAERNAPSLLAESEKLAAAKSAAIPAGELPDPKLNLGLQNIPIEGQERWTTQRDNMSMQMVGLMQEVPNRDKRRARIDTAQAAVERADAEAGVERLKVRNALAQAWIAAYTLQRKLAMFDDFYRENRLLDASVRARLASGGASAVDAVLPRQEAALLDERKDDLLSQQARARATLKRWIGEDAPQTLSGDFPRWSIDAPHYQQALHQHPELAAYGPMTREAEALVREAVAEKKPDWSWEVDYQHRGREFGDMMTLQVSFDLPLFSGTRQDPKIAARRAQVRQLDAEREALAREHEQQLADDLAEYRRLQRAVERSSATLLPLAEEKASLATASYRAGKLQLGEVLGARQQLLEERLRQLDLQGSLAQVAARLYFTYEGVRA
ncbi:TolC family protein [Pseudomonas nitroreducens]|uniref:TolC family protein n=1 Tax=Pseudomonas nitroreducens TaxID=46680 RepID=UPI002658CA56|nr:TolC family protein [Pseudomonas nitroreducens]MCP1651421.1 outer membrane protein TolC [Pseudomonas nitroreducens]MCP1689353.1 outer membrane protein TolC [Pseudomonas nitroreducens]